MMPITLDPARRCPAEDANGDHCARAVGHDGAHWCDDPCGELMANARRGRPSLPRCPRHQDAARATCSRCRDCRILRGTHKPRPEVPAALPSPQSCIACGAPYQPPRKGWRSPRCPNCERAWRIPERMAALVESVDFDALPPVLCKRAGDALIAAGSRGIRRARKAK